MIRFLKKRKFYILLIFLLLAIFVIYRNFSASDAKKKSETAVVTHGNLAEKLTLSGAIDADEKVILRFQTAGRLAWVGVKEGDVVTKFQSIAALDQREVKKKLELELNDYLKTRWDFEEAHRETYKNKVLSDTIKRILEKTQFDLNKSVLDVEIQNLSIEYANLWTPIEGIVTKVASPYGGVNIIPTQAEFEIVNPKTIYFSATADQTEVVSLTKGMTGELRLDSYPDTTFSGIIKDISFVPKTGETSTVYEIKFAFGGDNNDFKYRLGMAGDLSVVTKSRENVLYVPSKFVKTQNGLSTPLGTGKKYLTVKRNGKMQKVEVSTGIETDSDIEITSGISTGEAIYD